MDLGADAGMSRAVSDLADGRRLAVAALTQRRLSYSSIVHPVVFDQLPVAATAALAAAVQTHD